MTHCAVPTSTLKSCSIAGSATFSAVKSLAITITPSPIARSAITVPGAMLSALAGEAAASVAPSVAPPAVAIAAWPW